MCGSQGEKGFTLIELLVVVTIIVVLIALLVPSMDRAIYQAELVVCATRQKLMATNVVSYATDHARAYPNRRFQTDQPHTLSSPLALVGNPTLSSDDRPQMGLAVGDLNFLVDPLGKKVDLKAGGPNVYVYSSYFLWFGWNYRGMKGMRRLGDRLHYNDGEVEHRLNWLITDLDIVLASTPKVYASHPDRTGVLFNDATQEGKAVAGPPKDAASEKAFVYSVSTWVAAKAERGMVDINAAADDGAVIRFNDVSHNPQAAGDSRLIKTGNFGDSRGYDVDYYNVPKP